jgi:hypothetical protein
MRRVVGNGRIVISAFLLGRGDSRSYQFDHPVGRGCAVAFPAEPSRAVAYDEDLLISWFGSPATVLLGSWRGDGRVGPDWQDWLVF